jgi:hypothetical protein
MSVVSMNESAVVVQSDDDEVRSPCVLCMA